MTRLGKKSLRQKAVLWEASGSHDDAGRVTLEAAVEISCRWVATYKTALDSHGDPITVTAEVMVAQDVPDESILWLGEKEDLPDSPTRLMQVVGRANTPCVRDRATVRGLSLISYNDTLPDLA